MAEQRALLLPEWLGITGTALFFPNVDYEKKFTLSRVKNTADLFLSNVHALATFILPCFSSHDSFSKNEQAVSNYVTVGFGRLSHLDMDETFINEEQEEEPFYQSTKSC